MTSKQTPRKTEASKPATVTFSPYLMRRHREQLADWLHTQGVDPHTVSDSHAIQVKGSVITYRAFDLDDDGRPRLDQASSEVVTVERTARCTTPPPTLTQGDTEAT